MTLAVAAVCPWGRFVDRYRQHGFQIVDSIILASDSRWSIGRKPLLDVGKKLYVVQDNVGAVFAGDVAAGHDGIKRLQRQYGRARGRRFDDVAALAQEAFSFSYSRERALRKQRRQACSPLYYLVAMGSPAEGVRLIYCGYENDFRPEIRTGVQVLGDDPHKQMFLDSLDSNMARWYDEGQLVAEVTSWAIAVSGSLDAVMQRVGGTVGGKVQLGIVSRNGYHPLKIVSLDKVASGREDDVWRTITSEGSLVERFPK